jgi:hypothetical protein
MDAVDHRVDRYDLEGSRTDDRRVIAAADDDAIRSVGQQFPEG